MRALAFFGFLPTIGCFFLTVFLHSNDCFAWNCDCNYHLAYKEFYTLGSLCLSIFFLVFCLFYLFRIKEHNDNIAIQASNHSELLDDNFLLTNGIKSIYEHKHIKRLGKMGLGACFCLFLLIMVLSSSNCVPDANCVIPCTDVRWYDQEIYILGYGASAVYFIIMSVSSLLKSYPLKY